MQEKNRASCNKEGKKMQKRILLQEKKKKKIEVAIRKRTKNIKRKTKLAGSKREKCKKKPCYKRVCHINRNHNKRN